MWLVDPQCRLRYVLHYWVMSAANRPAKIWWLQVELQPILSFLYRNSPTRKKKDKGAWTGLSVCWVVGVFGIKITHKLDGSPQSLEEGCGLGQESTHSIIFWIQIRGQMQELFFVFFNIAYFKICPDFSKNTSWIKDLDWYLWLCGLWYRLESSEFKYGFIRGLLGLGRGIYSEEGEGRTY